MKLYIVSQQVNSDYDTYDSFVCRAKDEDEGQKYNPFAWVTPKDVIVKEITLEGESEIILASFNAG